MTIRIKGVDVRSIQNRLTGSGPDIDLRYDIEIKFSIEDRLQMDRMRGYKTEEMIDLIGEGIKAEMRRTHKRTE